MVAKQKTKKRLDSKSRLIEFHYERSNYFRVIKVNGAWGGLTPNAEVQMTIFSERLPLPSLDEFEILEDGQVGKHTRSFTKTKGITREIEGALIMTPAVARALGDWLIDKATQYEEHLAGLSTEPDEEPNTAEIIELTENKEI